MSIYHHVTA